MRVEKYKIFGIKNTKIKLKIYKKFSSLKITYSNFNDYSQRQRITGSTPLYSPLYLKKYIKKKLPVQHFEI